MRATTAFLVAPVVATGRIFAQTTSSLTRATGALFHRGGAGWSYLLARTRFDYRREVGDPSTNSAVVAVVGWIARNFPDAPVTITRLIPNPDAESSPTRQVVQPSPVDGFGAGRLLTLLERPNPSYSGPLQWHATLIDYFCRGDAYWVKVRDDAGRVVQLWWMPAQIFAPATWPEDDPTKFITHYEQRVGGRVYWWPVRDVVHMRYGIDPSDPRHGRSPLSSLYREIFTDDEASNMTASLVRNLGVPGVIIAPANTNTGPRTDNPQAVKDKFKDTFGGDGRGEPMVLTSPTDVKVLSFSPQQMSLRDLRKIPEERISAVLGVAAVVAGLGAGLDRSTFSNYGEARRAAYTESVIPFQRIIAADLEVQLLPDFPDLIGAGDRGFDPPPRGSSLDLAFDWTKATAMLEAAGDVWKRTLEAAKAGQLTRAQFLKANGLPAEDGDDVFVYPQNFQTVRRDGRQAVTPAAPATVPGRAPVPAGPNAGPILPGEAVGTLTAGGDA